METFWMVTVFVLGAIIGSFLNVVIYRLHTGKSLSGRSHCLSCGEKLKWYELFPVFSYLALRARCGHCASYIPSRYFVVEILTGTLFVLALTLSAGGYLLFIFNAVLFAILVVIVVYDIRHTIIPNEFVVALLVLALLFLIYQYNEVRTISSVVQNIISGLGAGGFFWILWFVSKGRWMGFGDAKLAFPLGIIVGPSAVFSMVVFSFWIGAIVSVSLLYTARMPRTWKTKVSFHSTQLTMKSEVPFAPFLVLGFLLTYAYYVDIFSFTLFFI